MSSHDVDYYESDGIGFYESIRTICPYQISLDLSANDIHLTSRIHQWIKENLTGKWYHHIQHNYGFQYEQDAVAFKLFWFDYENEEKVLDSINSL